MFDSINSKDIHSKELPKELPEQLPTLEFGLIREAINLRRQAVGMPLGIRRSELLRKADQADVVVETNRWLNSPGLRAPT